MADKQARQAMPEDTEPSGKKEEKTAGLKQHTEIANVKLTGADTIHKIHSRIKWLISQKFEEMAATGETEYWQSPNNKEKHYRVNTQTQSVVEKIDNDNGVNDDMDQEYNLTVVTDFFLLGFQCSQNVRPILFCLILVVYCGTICVNLLIITLVSTSKNLHTPMYFFISQLSISDILLTTNIVPNMLYVLLRNGGSITFLGCMTQFYFFSTSIASECFLLTVMSYDRYVAICNPLRYSSIMTKTCCVKLAISCWLVGFSIILINVSAVSKLHFCGPNVVDHLFCDLLPLLDISCSDTFVVQLEVILLSIPSVIIPIMIIIPSYAKIIYTILRIPSNISRQKAFSTCSSHLTVVSIFFWTLFSVYVFPTKGENRIMSKILSLLYTMFTPLVNPIIYSLRNKDILKAVQKILFRHTLHQNI
ncbi:olfactory receptor 6N1-like [Ranitomeya variabilis]|uniref:olfactory receptor 6N1-like n=1 Tax=Ranitomeya variabilis TaxID=490064 RepID=UPI00405677F4